MSPESPVTQSPTADAEQRRLAEEARRELNWKRWGPYLSERQWGTVREDYSEDGDSWRYFPFDDAARRAYRWGEDGLLGLTDRECRLCFALVLWNGRDPILKERLFGLSGPEGNHGEDVKEVYFYLDATPTASYLKALYKYPQRAFPYDELRRTNQRRDRTTAEYELTDTDAFDGGRYFDVFAEYAKASPDDVLIRLTCVNHGPEAARLHLLPTLWFRNTWTWRNAYEEWGRPTLEHEHEDRIRVAHESLGRFSFYFESSSGGVEPDPVFTENETNVASMYGVPNPSPYVKDAFGRYVVEGRKDVVNPARRGTKAALVYALEIPAGASETVRLRLSADVEPPSAPFGPAFDATFERRIAEADAFYDALHRDLDPARRAVCRQAYAGLVWNKQFYHYIVQDWLKGDPGQPPPPPGRQSVRNSDWRHLFNRDVISMPDKWEYPWYAAWDVAFHMVPFTRIDPRFAKEQILLFLREWYMHPNGQIPAYEWEFSDVNPPVHAWAAWRVYEHEAALGRPDVLFLARAFHKLVLNFTWWVNRKDPRGDHLFSGGFLGLDNIGVFDRSQPLPTGGHLEQADGTAWMAFYCSTMLTIALELAKHDPAMEDMASKFFEHFLAIVDAMNRIDGSGLWDEHDGFYHDHLHHDGQAVPLRVRSLVGIIPLFAATVLEQDVIDRLPGFKKRTEWFLKNRRDLARHIAYLETDASGKRRLLSVPSQDRLRHVLRYLLDESEFLSDYGIRSLSKVHEAKPFHFNVAGRSWTVKYVPGESDSGMFGGNSNWRGPIWLPLNYLIVEAIDRYHHFYGDAFLIECPTGSGRLVTLAAVAAEIVSRLERLFLPDSGGRRPCHGAEEQFRRSDWCDQMLFHEYFHGDTGRGLGASHQTGWTALIASLLERDRT